MAFGAMDKEIIECYCIVATLPLAQNWNLSWRGCCEVSIRFWCGAGPMNKRKYTNPIYLIIPRLLG